MIEARLRVRHANCLASAVPRGATLVQLSADGRGGLFSLTAPDADALGAALRSLGQVARVSVLRRREATAMLRVSGALACPHAPFDGASAILWPVVYADGEERVRALFADEGELRAALASMPGATVESRAPAPLDAAGVSMNVAALASALTRKQFDVISSAVEGGYYDIPRAVTTEDLARRFSISRTTYDEHLRKGEQALLREFLQILVAYPHLSESAMKGRGRPRKSAV